MRIIQLTGEEGDYDDFQSAFICLPAIPRKYEHANEHFLRLRHMNLHVIVVVAGSGPNTGQVSKMGEMAKQWLTQRRLICIIFNFFFFLNCCTVLHALQTNYRSEHRLHCTW